MKLLYMDEFFETDITNDETSLEKSILEISEKLVHYPNDHILLRQYSKNLLQTNDKTNYKVALDSAKKSISIKPNDFESKILILKSLRYLKRSDEALDYAERVKDEFPDNDQILEEISSCLLELNRNTEAEKILKKLELISPEKSRYNFGCLHLNYQNYEIALGFFSGILQENPSHIKSAIQKSYVLIQLGSMSKAILFCEKFINDYPENSAQIWRNLAGAYYRAGKISLEKNGYVEKESLDDHAVVDSKPVIRYELPVESKKFFQQAMNAYRTIGDMKISTPETAYFKAVTYSNLELFEDALG